jgi:GNAT superfamily N-acetyltransferase
VPISREHATEGFDCGKPPLNEWLQKYALQSDAAGAARVFVTTEDETDVVGYYALAGADIEPSEAPERVAEGLPKHRPISVVLLARLAVDSAHQSKGVGRSLLRYAMEQSAAAADIIGLRAIVVHAKDGEARNWYEKHGFEPSPTDPLHLIVLMKDVRAMLSA